MAIEVPRGFIVETLATNLNAATAIAPAPDGRIFIADQTGRLLVWRAGRVLAPPALALHVTDHWERGLIGLTLDPDFPRTPRLYLLYVTDRPFVHHVLSRFTVDGDRIDPASEKVLLAGDDQAKLGGGVPAGHQGGALRFGPDGKLYVSLGEQTAGEPAQRLDTLQGKILRLNPDGSIPDDNPFFTQTTGKYRAIYARGVRNSFGLAAQLPAAGGRMFFTDVGGSAFEEVNELKPGANYGWPHAEGCSTNAAFVNPLFAYPPVMGQSIVGGVFYPTTSAGADGRRLTSSSELGRRSSELKSEEPYVGSYNWPEKWRGRFLFADFMKHWIKALDPDTPTNLFTFARGLDGPVATELAPDGSLLVLNRGTVWRDPRKFVADTGSLLRIRHVGEGRLTDETPVSDAAQPEVAPALGLPANAAKLSNRLSAADWTSRVEAGQSRSFWVPESEWNPPALTKSRCFLPATGLVGFTDEGELRFPPGTVFVREFLMPLVSAPNDDFPVWRVIERRLHVVGVPRGYGASFRLDAAGHGELVEDGELANLGWARVQAETGFTNAVAHWWFPALDGALGEVVVNPSFRRVTAAAELNQPAGEDGPNILHELRHRGWLDLNAATVPVDAVPAGSLWTNTNAPAETRVRSYLHGNCAACHQPGGASRGNLDLRLTTPFARSGLMNADPLAGDLGIAGAKIVRPGAPEKSVLFRRLKDTGFFRMPPIAYHHEPSPILPVMEEWIQSLDDRTSRGTTSPLAPR